MLQKIVKIVNTSICICSRTHTHKKMEHVPFLLSTSVLFLPPGNVLNITLATLHLWLNLLIEL